MRTNGASLEPSREGSSMARDNSRRWSTPSRYPRTARINEVLREVIAEVLEREVDDDPRLELVTITDVETSTDLAHATVYFSALSANASLGEVATALDERRHVLQAAVGRNVRMKRTPHLKFVPDSGILEGQKIEELLHNVPEPVDQPDLEMPDDVK